MNQRSLKTQLDGRKSTRAFKIDNQPAEVHSEPVTGAAEVAKAKPVNVSKPAFTAASATEHRTKSGGSENERLPSKSAAVKPPKRVTMVGSEDCMGKPPGLYADVQSGCKVTLT